MNDIKEKYQEFKNEPFPEGITGEEIHGIDLVMLDADTAGLIEKFVGYNYKLTRPDYDLLKRLSVELKTVTKELDGQIIANFSLTMLLKTVVQNIDELEFLSNKNKKGY